MGKEIYVTIRERSGNIQLDYRHNGKRTRKTLDLPYTKENIKLVETKLIPKLKAELVLGIDKKRVKTFEYYGNQYMDNKSVQKSYDSKKYVYEKVIEYFKHKKIDSITRNDIKKYLRSLDIKKRSKSIYLGTVKGILDIALDDEAIKVNNAVGIILEDESDLHEIRVFSKDEVSSLLENSEGLLKCYLGIAFHTGMRAGEILGLKQSDIKDTYIDVKRSISKGKITTPKTKTSIRKVPILSELRPYLEELKNSKSFYLLQYNGKNLRDVSYFKRSWKALCAKCGIKYTAIKNTRHTFITQMLNSGNFKVMDIARIVGHNSPRMILTVYSGFVESEIPTIEQNFSLFGHNLVTSNKNQTVQKVL